MLEEVAKDAWEYGRKFLLQGKVADYIPELGKANPVHFGLCIKTEDGRHIEFGDSECRFTIQSICKIVSLAAALQYIGEEKVFKNVMMEPSGDAFNSILKLDTASNRPFNPMINAGAIEVVSLLAGRFSFEKMLEFIRTLCNDNEIILDESVYRSEKATGDRNRAIGYLLKSKTPDGLLNALAFVIFAIFGIYTAYQALNLISESVCPITVWPLLAAVTVAFVVICVWLYMKKKKGQDVSADKG